METIALLLLYALSQKPDFAESVKPLFGNLKSTEELLKFLNDLRKFSDFFTAFKQPTPNGNPPPTQPPSPDGNAGSSNTPPPPPFSPAPSSPSEQRAETEISPSPTAGIASEYIEKSLQAYFKKR